MKRPVPVILTAIFLGFLAALKLLGALSMAAVGVFALRRTFPTIPSPLPPSFLPILFFGMALVAVAAAAWSIVTLVGLVRLRSWARYSVLVIAGCITFFAGLSTLTTAAMPFIMSIIPTPAPAPNPGLMHGVFFVIGAIYFIFTLIGIALLVYFNLAKTRALFLQNAPISLDPPNTITGKRRPTAITVISWLYLICAPFCLIYAVLPFPTYLFGFVLYGLAARAIYCVFGVLTFAIGYGLLRLYNQARVAVFAFFLLCPLQLIVLLTPWGQRQFHVYMDAFTARMYGGQIAPVPNIATSAGAIIFFSFIAMAGYGVIFWLLHRHRDAFMAAPPAPPIPIDPEPLAGYPA